MKLSEIRAQIQIADETPLNPDGTWNGWDLYPRCNYRDLPASLQKAVRERYTPERLRRALIDIYCDPVMEQIFNNWTDEQRAEYERQRAEFPSMNALNQYISFYTLAAGIPKNTLEGLLIRARNSAIYTLEPGENDGITPELYANHAVTAFDTVIQQYRNPAPVDNSRPTDGTNAPPVSVLQEIQQPDEITFPKDIVTRKLFNNELTPGVTGRVTGKSKHEITVTDKAGKKTRAPIAPIVTVSLLDLPPNIQITRRMNSNDDAVFRAVCSLWAAGNARFTGQAIYAAMTGNPDAKATPEWLATIDECWTRQTSTQIELDTGTVGDAYKFKRWKRNRRVIEGGKDTVTIGNQFGQTTTTVYTMLEEPMLQTYANALNQTARFPRAMLNTPVNKTPEVIALQNVLLDHIGAIPHISNHLLYSTIWEKLHLQDNTPANEKRKEKMRAHIRKILAYWKKRGDIKDWKEVRQGNTLHHIEIVKPPQKQLPPAEQTPEKTGDNPGKNGG